MTTTARRFKDAIHEQFSGLETALSAPARDHVFAPSLLIDACLRQLLADNGIGDFPTTRGPAHPFELGDGEAGFGGGDFYAESLPVVKVCPPGRQ